MTHILEQITFKLDRNEIVADITPESTSEVRPIIETLNELGVSDKSSEYVWQPAIDTIDGKRPFPFWFGGDSMEVYVEEDGTWFRDQGEPRYTYGIKLSNLDARELMKRFMEAERRLKS